MAGDASVGEVVLLVRLLGLARDANEHAKAQSAAQSAADGPAAVAAAAAAAEAAASGSASPGGMAPGTIDAVEFYSPFLSEHLDAQRDYSAQLADRCQVAERRAAEAALALSKSIAEQDLLIKRYARQGAGAAAKAVSPLGAFNE